MLEKNKDYVEFTLQCTTVERSRDRNYREVCFNGYSDSDFPGVPMDVVCKEFDHKVVLVSKRDFERLQADNEHYREMAKQWEINYDLLFKKIGFDTVEELVNYLNSEAECDTLREAIATLEHNVKFARDERRDLSKKLEECEKDYISERDKAEALQTENEQLKKKSHEFDPIPDFKELFKKLYSIEDTEALEWALNHTCGGQASVNGWMASAKFWKQNYKTLSKLIGFSSVEEIQDYLTNESECDTLQEAVSKLKDQVKYTCDEWYSANSNNNSWKVAAECNSPKELIEKRETIEKEIQVYSRALQEWKEITGYPSPSAVKTALESGASWCHAYNEIKKANEKLGDDVNSWKNVTGYSTPEDYMRARISGAFHTPFDYTAAWQKATGCDTPDKARILLEKWKDMTKCETPEAAATWITSYESACERGNKFADDVRSWKNVTGYSTPESYFAARLNVAWQDVTGEQICGRDLRHNLQVDLEYYRSLSSAQAKSIYSWREATGCNTPEEAETTIRNLRGRIDEMKEFASIASNWSDRIVEG